MVCLRNQGNCEFNIKEFSLVFSYLKNDKI